MPSYTLIRFMATKKWLFGAVFKLSVLEDAEKTTNRASSPAPEVYCRRP